MMLNHKQQTINKSVTLSGVGLHTGVQTNMTFLPAKSNHGIKFQRIDLPGSPIVEADCDLVVDVSVDQWMTALAMSLGRVERRRRSAATSVFPPGYWLHMRRVYASAIAANVVDVQAVWDQADQSLISKAMG